MMSLPASVPVIETADLVLRGYRESGDVAGRVGVIFNDGWHEPELAWNLCDGHEGRSLAYRASLAARSFAAERFGMDGIMSCIVPANRRSIRLAERLGCRIEREAELLGKSCQIWRHPKCGAR